MSNWKKIITSGSTATLQSLEVVDNITATSITGSLSGSVTNAQSSSYAVTASYVLSYPAFTFDGGTPSTNFTSGPIFDLGGVT